MSEKSKPILACWNCSGDVFIFQRYSDLETTIGYCGGCGAALRELRQLANVLAPYMEPQYFTTLRFVPRARPDVAFVRWRHFANAGRNMEANVLLRGFGEITDQDSLADALKRGLAELKWPAHWRCGGAEGGEDE